MTAKMQSVKQKTNAQNEIFTNMSTMTMSESPEKSHNRLFWTKLQYDWL